jgi:hypothetical protein
MLNQFTFQYHTLELIQNNMNKFIKGTIMCDTIIYDEKLKKPVLKSVNYFDPQSTSKDNNSKAFEGKLLELMNCSQRTKWHLYKDFKWLKNDHENIELNLFVKPAILQVTLDKKPHSDYCDVILFYFPNNLSNFRLTDTEEIKGITADEQRIIENMILQTIDFIGGNIESDIKNWAELSSHYKQQELEILRLKADREKELSNFSKSIIRHCQRQLEKIAGANGLELKFSDELIEKLKALREVPLSIADDINKAIQISRLKNQQNEKKQIIIGVTDIAITLEQEEVKAVEDQTIEIQMRAPYGFLERIETAMQLLDYQRKPFTGENVGAYMKPTVTKSAITQYRNSHQQDLIQLLTLHPEKWPLTRNHFKPIKNLLDNQAMAKKNKRAVND